MGAFWSVSALLVVVLLILAMQHVLEKSQSGVKNGGKVSEAFALVSQGDIPGVESTVRDMIASEDKIESEEDAETEQEEETGSESENENNHTDEVALHNGVIENVAALDNTSWGWGMGPSRDELNRPTDALNYQKKYAAYSVDFIKDTEEKIIYLTFDEGYEYGVTPQILDTLKEKDVKAVFFVTKPYAKSQPELVQRMIDEGHIIGNHTEHHPASGMPSLSLESQRDEIMATDEYVRDNFGYSMYLFRYPAGLFSEQSLANVTNCNYRSVFWSAAYRDWDVNNQPDETEAMDILMQKLHPGAIYLLHAESQTNANILGNFIDRVREQGYEIGVYSDTL